MLHALSLFSQQPPNVLPLSPTLPDLKSDTTSYIQLQNLYKTQANLEKAKFVEILEDVRTKAGVETPIPTVLVDEFVKNCHQLKILKGKVVGDEDDAALGTPVYLLVSLITVADLLLCSSNQFYCIVTAIMTNPSQVATHLAFNALFEFQAANGKFPTPGSKTDLAALNKLIDLRLEKAGHVHEEVVPAGVDEAATGPVELTFRQHLENAVGEMYVPRMTQMLFQTSSETC